MRGGRTCLESAGLIRAAHWKGAGCPQKAAFRIGRIAGEGLLASAMELAEAIARSAPLAVTAARDILRATEGVEVEQGYTLMRSGAIPSYRAMLDSDDVLEGPRAFAEGRAPEWKGR